MLPPISTMAPASAVTRPRRNARVTVWRNMSQAASVTKTGVKLANSVELAMVVSSSDQCQHARSPAKNTPASSKVA